MNASLNDFTGAYDKRSIEARRHEQESKAVAKRKSLIGALSGLAEKLLCLLDAILEALSSSKTLTVFRTAVTVVCFLSVVGIIGGIESGKIGWISGIVCAIIAAVIEAICIKKCKATPHNSDGTIAPSGFSSDNTKRRG